MSRLPNRIDFGIAIVNVKQVGMREMRDAADCEDDDPTPDGCWDADTDSIYVLRKLSLRRKREVFFHELVHAAIDNQYWARHGV